MKKNSEYAKQNVPVSSSVIDESNNHIAFVEVKHRYNQITQCSK
ncbi:hypothetical protein T07_10286 [Trichinella nelsoni]|uniref:Uncharacterized protein n=1 Tax=Trichinella nelsoni TaxID=6336 RepID=A0A0V0RBI2_9BILA|nr:hypothetical protein T07_10286 [Trichinella nelsoni]